MPTTGKLKVKLLDKYQAMQKSTENENTKAVLVKYQRDSTEKGNEGHHKAKVANNLNAMNAETLTIFRKIAGQSGLKINRM